MTNKDILINYLTQSSESQGVSIEVVRKELGLTNEDLQSAILLAHGDGVIDLLSNGKIRVTDNGTEQYENKDNSKLDFKEMKKTRILFFAANPSGMAQLSLNKEIRSIREKVRASEKRDFLEIDSRWATRPDDLLQALNEFRPDIVHFSGHGSKRSELILVDDELGPRPVSLDALRSLFCAMKDNIRVVVLNACYSSAQAKVISENIDCTIGMNDAVSDEAAITFAASFYRAIGFGRSVKQAYEQSKAALLLAGIEENETPIIVGRQGVDLDCLTLV